MLCHARMIALLSLAMSLVTGCARYECDIVQPPELAGPVAESRDTTFARGPLLYRLRGYENHLVIRVFNPTPQPVELLGGRSVVVDPEGQSHPFSDETIAPESFIKLVLPPIAPEIAPVGPVIGFGLGMSSAYGPGYDLSFDSPLFVRPRYYASTDMENRFWKWEGESDVRLSLTFARAGQPAFSQQFVFHRRKM
jgi:hypothetical protein